MLHILKIEASTYYSNFHVNNPKPPALFPTLKYRTLFILSPVCSYDAS